MDPQNQYYYNRNQGVPGCMPPQQQQQQQQQQLQQQQQQQQQPRQPDPAYPVNNIDHSKMGPMMRALTEDFDIPGQNSAANYPPPQGMPNVAVAPGAGDQQRLPSNSFGPASQTLSGYASQYSSGPASHNYFGHGHATPAVNSGFTSPSANYPPGTMGSPYPRPVPGSSPLGSPNGHGHHYPRSASAGPTIPSPIMMHSPGMYPHNQPSPGNRSSHFGFPTSPTSPHNHLNHTSPPLTSPSGMRPGGTLHSPKSLPASSPVPFGSQMSPTASRAQSVPTLPGNSLDHMPSMSHARSKSPGSAGIHRPYPQPPGHQQLYPLPSPKVRPVDQTDSRGQYVELVHTTPSGDTRNPAERPNNDRSRNPSGHRKMSDPGHLPRLEEMVAVLSESNVKETLDEIVSDKNLPVIENGSPSEVKNLENGNRAVHASNDKLIPEIKDKETMSNEQKKVGLANGLSGSAESNEDKKSSENGPVNEQNLDKVTNSSLQKVTKTYSSKVICKANGRTDNAEQGKVETPDSTNIVSNPPFKPPMSKRAKRQTSDETKDTVVCKQEQADESSETELKKCQSESTQPICNHSPKSEPGEGVPSTSSKDEGKSSPVPQTPPPCDKSVKTPTSKRISPEDSGSGSSTGNESLPLKKRRGRPPGSRNRKEGEEVKPKKRYPKKKKLDMGGEPEEDPGKTKLAKPSVKAKAEVLVSTPHASVVAPRGPAVVPRGPVLRLQGASVESVVSSKFVNSPDVEEDNSKMGKKKQKMVKHVKRHSVLIAGHVGQPAVLASDCRNPTGLWVCTLCGNPPNFGILGDLYGPYFPPGCDTSSPARDSSSRSNKVRRVDGPESHHSSRGSGSSGSRLGQGTSRKGPTQQEAKTQRGKSLIARQADPAKTRKWRQVKTYMEEMSLESGRKSTKRRKSESEDGQLELWIHEECAVWSQGVIFLQGTLYGIHEAVKEAECKKCFLCRDTGASIGCLSKGCKQVYHYMCALESECKLHQDNYSMSCPKHKDKKVKMRGET